MNSEYPTRAGLAFHKLTNLPVKVIRHYIGPDCVVLDLTHNRIRDFEFLSCLPQLGTLVLDHNGLTSDVEFPRVPHLTTLSANHNCIADLDRFVGMLSASCPNLTTLSMMYNEAAPNYFTNHSHQQYRNYRYRVISKMTSLRILDDTEVTAQERLAADYHDRCMRQSTSIRTHANDEGFDTEMLDTM